MTMLHEYLKLCYMNSNYDDKIIPAPKALSIHLIATIGHTASHYIHKIRMKGRGPLKYESHFAANFNLKEAGDRNQFRDRLNRIHVLHVTVFKEAVREKLKDVLALRDSLGEREIYRQLEQRTHKGVQVSVASNNGAWEISVNRDGDNPPLPSPPPSNMQSTTPDTTKAPEYKDNEDGALAAFTSQASTLVKLTKDKNDRCQARLRTPQQCKNTARRGQESCGIKLHQELVKNKVAQQSTTSEIQAMEVMKISLRLLEDC